MLSQLDGPISISRTHVNGGDNRFHKAFVWPPHACHDTATPCPMCGLPHLLTIRILMIYIFQIERRWISFMQKRMPKAHQVTHNKDSGSKGVWVPIPLWECHVREPASSKKGTWPVGKALFPKSRLHFTEQRKTTKGFKVSLFHRRQQKKVT